MILSVIPRGISWLHENSCLPMRVVVRCTFSWLPLCKVCWYHIALCMMCVCKYVLCVWVCIIYTGIYFCILVSTIMCTISYVPLIWSSLPSVCYMSVYCKTLKFDGWLELWNYFGALNFSGCAEPLAIQYAKLPLKYSQPVIFANLPRSRNSRNKWHMKILGFPVLCSM